MAFIRKIKGSLVRQDSAIYTGEDTYLFYDIETGCIKRSVPGIPGGVLIDPLCMGFGTLAEIQDEGIEVTPGATLLNFAGAGVTASEPGPSGEILITIPGSVATGSAIEVEDEGVSLTTDVTKFNFVGDGVTVTEPVADEVLVTIPDTSITGLALTVINGQPMLTVEDTTRSDKILSVGEQGLMWSENKLNDLDWMEIGNAVDSDTGYIADFDGTIVYGSAHCEDTGVNSKDLRIYIDGVDTVLLGTLSGGANATVNNTTLNTDFTQGQRIRIRAINGAGGAIQDTVAKLTVKWRG